MGVWYSLSESPFFEIERGDVGEVDGQDRRGEKQVYHQALSISASAAFR